MYKPLSIKHQFVDGVNYHMWSSNVKALGDRHYDQTYLKSMVNRADGTVHFEDNFHCGGSYMIIMQNHNYDLGEFIPYGSDYILKTVTIEDNVWFGKKVLVAVNVHIR